MKGQVYLRLTRLTLYILKQMVNYTVITGGTISLMTDTFLIKSKVELTLVSKSWIDSLFELNLFELFAESISHLNHPNR